MARKEQLGIRYIVVALLVVACVALTACRSDALDFLTNLLQGSNEESQEQFDQVDDDGAQQPTRYVFSQLSEDDQEKYLIVLDAFKSRTSKDYPSADLDDLGRIRDCVLADHPEMFYVNGAQMHTTTNSRDGSVISVTIEGQYAFSAEETESMQQQIDDVAAQCLAALPEEADDYAKAKLLYEYLAENVEYDHDAANGGSGVFGTSSGQTIAEALVGRKAVCAGYARAYQYLLTKAGIPCMYVTGSANGGSHAWCVACLDEYWYHIDPTWGDPQYLGDGGAAADSGRINYDYLCVNDEDVAITHALGSPYPVPACTRIDDNYFVREGLYLTAPNIETAGAMIEQAAAQGDPAVRFRCANRGIYDQVVDALFNQQEIGRFIPGDTCSYVLGDAICTIEVIFT